MAAIHSTLSSPTAHSLPPSWRSDFLNSLIQRDKREKSHDDFIYSYSRLASRAASSYDSPSSSKDATAAPGEGVQGAGDVGGTTAGLIQLKADLTAAQQSKTYLQQTLKALGEEKETLQKKLDQQDRITSERNRLDRRTRDLEEEVRAKNKYIQELQDEILTLTMELNMLAKREEAVRSENKELVDRYMAEMAKKAESMNRASNWE